VTPHGCFVVGVAVLAAYNVARGLGAFGAFGDASAALLLGAFVALAWMTKLTLVDLGLARADAGRGAMYGLAALLITTAVLVVVALIPATSDFLEDSRADVTGPRLLFELVAPILLLTVIPEEFAFRGVMLASGRAVWSDRAAVLATSALFGLWHISPTLRTLDENRQLDDATTTTGGTILLVIGTVLATFVAGLVFSWLRLRSRSLLAPFIAHLATNGAALVVAWLVVH
jgi:membrane protease YdiL (CAAX protease family)